MSQFDHLDLDGHLLRLLLLVLEEGSITRAAQRLGVTQSAVSQQIRSLENQFRATLIERSKKKFRLTREGQILYGHSKQIIQTYDSAEDESTKQTVKNARYSLSAIHVQLGDEVKGEEILQEVFREDPDDTQVNNDLGYLWADQNERLARAHRMIRQAVEAEPENAAYRDSLGWVLYRLGRHEEAVSEQKKAVELAKSKDKESDGVMYDHLGDIHAALGQKAEASAAWREAAAAFEKAGEKDKLEAVRKKLKAE